MRELLWSLLTIIPLVGCGVPDAPGQEPDPYRTGVQRSALTGPITVTPDTVTCDASATSFYDGVNLNFLGGACYYVVPVVAGDAIASVTLPVFDNGPLNGHTLDGNNVIAELVSRAPGRSDVFIASASSNGSGTAQTLMVTPLGSAYVVKASDAQILVEVFGLRKTVPPSPSIVSSSSGTAVVSQARIISIPLFVPYLSGAPINRSMSTFGPNGPSGIEVQLSGVPVGATVTQIAARLQDTVRTQCAISIVDQQDNVGVVVAPATTFSSGTGSPQTMTLGINMTVASMHNYWVSVLVNNQQDPCLLYSLEAAYR